MITNSLSELLLPCQLRDLVIIQEKVCDSLEQMSFPSTSKCSARKWALELKYIFNIYKSST